MSNPHPKVFGFVLQHPTKKKWLGYSSITATELEWVKERWRAEIRSSSKDWKHPLRDYPGSFTVALVEK